MKQDNCQKFTQAPAFWLVSITRNWKLNYIDVKLLFSYIAQNKLNTLAIIYKALLQSFVFSSLSGYIFIFFIHQMGKVLLLLLIRWVKFFPQNNFHAPREYQMVRP